MVVDHYAIRNDEKTLNWVGGIVVLLGISVKCIDCAGEPDRFSIPEVEVYALEGSEISIFEDLSNQQPKSGHYKLSTLEGTLAVDYKKCGTKDDARLTITTDENHERYWAILRATDYTIVKTSDSSKFLHNLNSTNFRSNQTDRRQLDSEVKELLRKAEKYMCSERIYYDIKYNNRR